VSLGTGEDAAQKRVSRAVERLREYFTKQGVTLGTGGLVALISANAVHAAPVGLAASISSAAVLSTAVVQAPIVLATTKTIAMTTLQKAVIGATLAALAGTGIYEAHQASRMRAQVQAIQQQQAAIADQLQQVQLERDDATNQLNSLLVQNEQLKTNQNTAEVLRLRREVASLRSQARRLAQFQSPDSQNASDPMESAAKDLVSKINLLKQRLEQMPDKNIPELQYLDKEAWARVAQTAKFDTDADVREALASLRNLAKQSFAPQLGQALQAFAQANNGQLPADASQLKPYFKSPVDDATLARYQMIGTGNVRDLQPLQMVIAEKAVVDDHYDSLFQIGLDGRKSQSFGPNGNVGESVAWSSNSNTSEPPSTGK
jgi:hypothetical protein